MFFDSVWSSNKIFFFAVIDSCRVSVTTKEGNRVTTSSICGEHGHCVSLGGGEFKCQCIAGYSGKYCHKSKFFNFE